jgi:hypothetical protein
MDKFTDCYKPVNFINSHETKRKNKNKINHESKWLAYNKPSEV